MRARAFVASLRISLQIHRSWWFLFIFAIIHRTIVKQNINLRREKPLFLSEVVFPLDYLSYKREGRGGVSREIASCSSSSNCTSMLSRRISRVARAHTQRYTITIMIWNYNACIRAKWILRRETYCARVDIGHSSSMRTTMSDRARDLAGSEQFVIKSTHVARPKWPTKNFHVKLT